MGLDNAVILQTRHPLNPNEIPEAFHERLCIGDYAPETERTPNKDGFYEYELCYWRKWWHLRNTFGFYIKGLKDDICEYDVTRKDLKYLSDLILEIMLDPEAWGEEGNIFSYNEMLPIISLDVVILNWFSKWQPTNQIVFKFIDSY